MRKSNYDKFPSTPIDGHIVIGWDGILQLLETELGQEKVWAVDLYVGSYEEDFITAFRRTGREVIDVRTLMRPEEEIEALTQRFMTDDVLFGYMSNLTLEDYFRKDALASVRSRILNGGQYVLVGTGAGYVTGEGVPVVYADLARWEIQQRFRRHEVKALGLDRREDSPSVQYKRGYFNDWNVCDAHKDNLFCSGRIRYWIDHNGRQTPKLISDSQLRQGLERTVAGPFRVVPFFDPAPWGGQWMREVCGLDDSQPNYGWCFDCVPEENSLLFDASETKFELPSQDLVLWHPKELLGERVWARFGRSFPIRFDFLDTMGGGNLSLQVHPTIDFARREFGLSYTQDESYYLLDAGEGATVYLGLKEGVDRHRMISDLRAAQRGEISFPAEKYVNRIPARKHDHFLIPSGTIHCSGSNGMVLEISATPSIFTFKLWDWGRLGLDGKPRPINIERGKEVIQWDRTTPFVMSQLHNRFEILHEEEGIKEERTGLHRFEFIETRRHTFDRTVCHDTHEGVDVLNLCEGEEAVIESAEGAFRPFKVHYAETFIIPAAVGRYTITPSGPSAGKTCKTIKASVR